MADDVASLTYELLTQVSTRLQRVDEDVGEVKIRLTALETTQGLMRQEMAQQSIHVATLNNRMDRMDVRLDRMDERLDRIDRRLDRMDERLEGFDGRLARIERRLDLTDA